MNPIIPKPARPRLHTIVGLDFKDVSGARYATFQLCLINGHGSPLCVAVYQHYADKPETVAWAPCIAPEGDNPRLVAVLKRYGRKWLSRSMPLQFTA